jgi:cytidylate kinase
MIVAIDGPSGSGKSSVAKEVSARLGFATLDTGAMYRAVTVRGLQEGFDLKSISDLDDVAVPEYIKDIRAWLVNVSNTEAITFDFNEKGQAEKVFIGGQDVTFDIRTPETDATVSVVSACSDIRTAMVAQQREIGAKTNTVLEGRDIGTVVFPNADVKIFLTASPEARANRRHLQNIERGIKDSDEQAILEMIKYRDGYDSSRAVSPLSVAEGAHVIETTDMSFEEVVDAVIDLVSAKRGA